MKTIIYLLLLISIIPLYTYSKAKSSFDDLNTLYQNEEYFKLIDRLETEKANLEQWQYSFFEAVIQNKLNKPRESNKNINTLLENFKYNLHDSLKLELYECKLINHVHLFEYNLALETSKIILSKYKSLLDSSETDEMQNSELIWNAAKDMKPQTSEIKGDSRIKIEKDLAGLVNIPVKSNNIESEFIFDTGANISTISESYAKKMNFKMLPGKIQVGTATDKKVETGLAYAETFEIGNMVFHNVLFLVVADEYLTFAGGLYVINGIIGFPVIKEMKEIQMSSDELYIPAVPGNKKYRNLAVEGFTPLVNIVYGKDSLIFSFDSGARTTALYCPFFNKYKEKISSKYELDEIELDGAGGKMKYKGYVIDKVKLNVAGRESTIEDIKLLAEEFKDDDKKFRYGNLGRDFINSFRTMVLNFDSMYIEFIP
jgi:predicted aspartyl protease